MIISVGAFRGGRRGRRFPSVSWRGMTVVVGLLRAISSATHLSTHGLAGISIQVYGMREGYVYMKI